MVGTGLVGPGGIVGEIAHAGTLSDRPISQTDPEELHSSSTVGASP